MPTAVITGCNSGQGYAFAELLLKEGYDVYATDITVGDKLKSLGCPMAQLDVTSPDSIAAFKKNLGDRPVDVLLNIAGIMVPPELDSLQHVNLPILTKSFEINTFGPLLLTQALLPNLLAASTSRVGVMSSRVGSIADNSTGGYIAYRASKTAVNSIFKSLAVELKDKGVIITLMHPGFVKTNLSPHIHKIKDAVEADEAVAKLWKVLMSKGIEDTGKFWHREGQELPW